MAYKKPNLYRENRQEMLNNIAMSSNSYTCGISNAVCNITGIAPPGCNPISGNPTTRPPACIQRPSWQNSAPLMDVQANESKVCLPTSIGGCGSTTYNPTTGGCGTVTHSGCGSTSFNPTICHINQRHGLSAPIDFASDDFISVDLDPHTNEIRITAGSAYPIEQLAELCRELYT